MFDDPYAATSDEETAKSALRLLTWPTLEETEEQAQRIVTELAAFIDLLVPGMTWSWNYEREQGACLRPFEHTQGKKINFPIYGGSKPIPDAQWPKTLKKARELAVTIGATGYGGFTDDPGNHVGRFHSASGTSLFFASSVKVAIVVNTGCRLPAAVKQAPR